MQGPRAGRQGRLLLVRFLNGQTPDAFSPLWDHIIVTDARWADRVADAGGGSGDQGGGGGVHGLSQPARRSFGK